MHAPHNIKSGFTLLETVIYIGLFAIIFSGIFVSMYPLFMSAERLTRNSIIEGESAFMLAKISQALTDTITSSEGRIVTPARGDSADTLVLTYRGDARYMFAIDTTNVFCTAPRICSMFTLSIDGGIPQPLNASRVQIKNFTVAHGLQGVTRYLDISFTINDEPIGPVRYYVHF